MLTLDNLLIEQDDFRLSADFAIPPAARVALLGPSGAGKSTLLATLAGFLAPGRGRILWRGADITGLAPGARPLSILFQDQNLFPHLNVAQNLGLGLSPKLRLARADHAQIAAALDRVGLSGLGDRRPATLSGGQQSRVALARCLLRAKPLLLLDEPFAALGPALKSDMLALVAEIAADQHATVLMVSHEPADAVALCPQTVLVAEGVAHPPAATAGLLADPPPALAAYLGK
ncbi:thiamine ABC transporter ATP-binding protein [Rhodobacter capsulatus]|uniref:Thiamine ABC transporter, ATP-binding protein n=1 Tax=Rhodobacter capsulatus (strain ATCC BAA-309 / NBRC 16581 / SB1003) TaxID=272942 RepID=D5AND9_RHOCB|nr:ATP-binding cassette domain-containing protein [Rhodobacter capsulatus]ADE86429.1 thiamine ABC transporter, ATP-binding protein [Rhodobacter capsulatus SB 1003]ETD00678.1 thiamine ABC transporter ATP-binding protein [Rhodobacter capsulatus DE442]ETD75310.1 thiamine ABC transporter ATP-binding protein [Rhodobacter capsulatus R121]ETE52739.1 thiamine ABC transporter ATP-binding protein [Rhodobacter capsulatus Y262]MDS0928238.1 ATP-binding cassette domain-containing protein [Rhodobacter capsul